MRTKSSNLQEGERNGSDREDGEQPDDYGHAHLLQVDHVDRHSDHHRREGTG